MVGLFNELFLYWKNKEYSFILLMLLCLFPILPFAVASILIIAFSILSLFLNYKGFKKRFIEIGVKPLLLLSGFYVFSAITFFYSENINVANREIQRGLSFFIIPFCILYFSPKINKKKIQHLLLFLTFANVILCLQYLLALGWLLFVRGDSFLSFNFRGKIFVHALIEMDPTYISLCFSLSIAFLVDFYLKSKRIYNKIFIIFFIALFLLFIFLVSARTVIVALLLILIIYFCYVIFNKQKYIKSLVLFMGVVGLTIFVMSKSKLYDGRIKEALNSSNFSTPSQNNLSSISIRVGIYDCTLDIIKNAPFFGVGIGDFQDELDRCYNKFDTTIYQKHQMNVHNQYLQYLTIGGLVCFLLFIWSLLGGFEMALKNNDYLYLIYLFILCVTFTTESILARVHGVMFFAIFNTVFYYKNILKNKQC